MPDLPALRDPAGVPAERTDALPEKPGKPRRLKPRREVALGPSPLPEARAPRSIDASAVVPEPIFEIDPDALLPVLKVLMTVIETRNTLPILNHVLFVDGGVVGTDLDVTVTARVASIRALPLALPAKPLLEILRAETGAGSAKALVFGVNRKTNQIVIAGKARYGLYGLAAGEFPDVPKAIKDADTVRCVEIPPLDPVLSAVSTDRTQFAMSGVFFQFCKNRVTATDSHRLHQLRHLKSSQHGDFLISEKTCRAVEAIRKVTQAQVDGEFGKGFSEFQSGCFAVTARNLDVEFPDYERVMTDSFRYAFSLPRKEFLAALKKAGRFAARTSSGPVVTLRRTVAGVEVVSGNEDGDKFKGVIPCKEWDPQTPAATAVNDEFERLVSEEKRNHRDAEADLESLRKKAVSNATRYEREISINPKYLADALRWIPEEWVVFGFNGARAPLTLRRGSFQAVISPVA